MTFSDLKDFLINRMRMSHIYQPVMLMTLLKNGGVASVESLAKDLLINDQSQMEHYDNVTKNMVGRILTKNKVVKRDVNSLNLLDYETFNEKERNELINILSVPQSQVSQHQKRFENILHTAINKGLKGTDLVGVVKVTK